jgi:hypothetical protein
MNLITRFTLALALPAALLAVLLGADAAVLCPATFVAGLVVWTVAQYGRRYELRARGRPVRLPTAPLRPSFAAPKSAPTRLAA